MSQYYTASDHFVLIPAIMLLLFGCGIFLFDFWIFPQSRQKKHLIWFVLLGVAFTAVGLARQWNYLRENGLESISAFQGTVTIDGFAIFFNIVFLAATLLVALISYRYLEEEGEHRGEYYGLLLLANHGMFFLAAGTDLITIFIGLEVMAVSFYVMVGFLQRDKRSNEAAIKYFLLGALASGLILYGFSLLYGMAGSTKLSEIAKALTGRNPWEPMTFLALVTVAAGLLFKIAAVPFHMWAPDTYEGAPTTVTAYLSVASKAASFAILVRIFLGPFAPLREVWEPILAAVAIITLTVGNLAAISQTNLKRLLAYSSISHAGYILLGLVAGNTTGLQGVAVYILVYTFMNLGAFLVITTLRRKELLGEDIDEISGLMQLSPGHALLMLVFLLALAGIPPTAGFIAKYYIFLSLVQTGHYYLAAIGAIYVAVAIYYYFRIVRRMFTAEIMERAPLAASLGLRIASVVTIILTLGIGIYPEPFLKLAQSSLFR